MNSFMSSLGFTPLKPASVKETKSTSIKYDNMPVEHTDQFKIVVILDESGSMEGIRDDMIKSLNDLILEQKQIKERPCRFTLVKFNDSVHRIIRNKDLREIRPLTREDYRPDRCTALYDAIGDTVNWFRYERDVLLVIITDGHENASKKYNLTDVKKMLEEKKDYCGWSYIYLSDDLSKARQGTSLGCNVSNYSTNCVREQAAFGSYISNDICGAVSQFRKKGANIQTQLNKKL